MKKFLSILGGIFLFLVVALVGSIGYATYQGRGLDASSKAYVETNIPSILSSWSKDELLKRACPQLLKVANDKPEQMDQLFQKLSKLGALRRFGDLKGDSNVSYTTRDGKVVSAFYTATAQFENGSAQIAIRLVQSPEGEWQIMLFNLDSPMFLQ